jgi:hypothetical protein
MNKLLWIPVDIPLFPVTEKLLNQVKKEQFYFWDFYRLTEKMPSAYDKAQWKEEVLAEFPEIIDWFKNLPIKSIRNVKLNVQTRKVAPHIDFTKPDENPVLWKNNNDSEPCGYRILLSGTRTNTLYAVNSRGEKVYCTMPADTNTYLLRQTDGWHGVEDDTDRMILYPHLEIDIDAHGIILQRSISKYSEYAIYDK